MTQKSNYTLYFHVFDFTVFSWSVTVYLHSIFHLDVLAATSVCSVICQCCLSKLEEKFWIYVFWLNLFTELLIQCDVSRQLRLNTTAGLSDLLCSVSELWNIVTYHNMHRIATYCDRIIWWSPRQHPALHTCLLRQLWQWRQWWHEKWYLLQTQHMLTYTE